MLINFLIRTATLFVAPLFLLESTVLEGAQKNDWPMYAASCDNACTGPQGVVGPTGPEGPEGAQGDVGAEGPAGQKGDPGTNGVNGINGANGSDGPVGPQGPVGPEGDVGPAGTNGLSGIGPAGPTGPTGPATPLGPTGPNGPTGPTGPSGVTGLAGPTGPQGGVFEFAYMEAIFPQTNIQDGDLIRFDTSTLYAGFSSFPPGGVVVPSTAIYLVAYTVNTNAVGGVILQRNGIPIPSSAFGNLSDGDVIIGNCTLSLNAGDIIEMYSISANPFDTQVVGGLVQSFTAYASLTLIRL